MKTHAIIHARIDTIVDGIVENGTLIIEGNSLAAVGAGIPVPAGAEVIDACGRPVTPGLIDPHSHAGLAEDGFAEDSDYNEKSSPITPHLQALDGFKPSDASMWEGLMNGVTTICITPGSANVMGGMVAIVKTWAPDFYSYIVQAPAGLKVATGENPKRVYGSKDKAPTTRMGVAALFRETLTEAQNYIEKKARGSEKPEKIGEPFKTDLKLEAVARVLSGELPVRCHAHRSIDMLTFMRIAREFGLRYVFEHATEAVDILNELRAENVSIILGPTMGGRSKVELLQKSFKTAARAVAAGLTVALTADHGYNRLNHLPVYAALCVREGLPEREAMKCLTINPARILGIDDRYGSLEKGKRADVVVWSGDPLDARSRPDHIFIEGHRIDPAADRGRITGG